MANTKQAKKMIRVAETRRLRNRPIRSGVRTFVRRAQAAIEETATGETTATAVREAISKLDRAVSKGVIHPNNAARRKSRLMKRFHVAASAT
ncbi:MAG: 30S ribosomal protein S20 [Chloroflexota bacterium]|nr:MAG: 30S ribosomal protein S20 [Chloroflexota bacterium]